MARPRDWCEDPLQSRRRTFREHSKEAEAEPETRHVLYLSRGCPMERRAAGSRVRKAPASHSPLLPLLAPLLGLALVRGERLAVIVVSD